MMLAASCLVFRWLLHLLNSLIYHQCQRHPTMGRQPEYSALVLFEHFHVSKFVLVSCFESIFLSARNWFFYDVQEQMETRIISLGKGYSESLKVPLVLVKNFWHFSHLFALHYLICFYLFLLCYLGSEVCQTPRKIFAYFDFVKCSLLIQTSCH